MRAPLPNQADLFREGEELLQNGEEAAASKEDSAPSAMDEFFNRSSPEIKANVLRMLRRQPLAANDPLLIVASGIMAKIAELIETLNSHSSEQEANLHGAIQSATQAYDVLVSAETGATKYAARLHEITEETKVAVAEATAHLNVLVKLRETGSEVLNEALSSVLPRLLWKTAAGVLAADLAIRLLIAHLP